MRTVIVSTSASGIYSGNGAVGIPLDHYRTPFNIGIGVVPVSGTPSITVQHTFSDPFDASTTAYWFDHAALTGVATTVDGNYAFPVAAVRVVQTGAGDAKVFIIQAGLYN